MSSSSGILISAVILPSDPSWACPTFPLPRIRPSAIPFCWLSLDTSTAVSVTAAPLVWIAHMGIRSGVTPAAHDPWGDRSPAQGHLQEIRAEVPFASYAAPLVE